ncbi:hypothetical protein NQ317_015397 [Molorchus minor]|uniref:Farnesol dehydrogenase-like n=1 Tax=Molorchus minor TaxID=1323400 RepID=A0ABQ9IT94_9CUCU|nr:hypothetical protein NQ317_015397 [Molorchus minor]
MISCVTPLTNSLCKSVKSINNYHYIRVGTVNVISKMVLSMDRWVGKVAVVTGASSGIGAAVAEQLVENGLKVVGLARREDVLIDLAHKLTGKKGKLYPIKTDVSKEGDIMNAFKWTKENVGPVHILVNTAGMLKVGNTLSDGDAETWRNTFDVNVLGLCISTREAVRDMKANNVDGHIIHINSLAGHNVYNLSGFNVYSASKYANLSPGLVLTDILPAGYSDIVKTMKKENRILYAQDIADAIIYALSTPPHVQIQELTIRPILDPNFPK